MWEYWWSFSTNVSSPCGCLLALFLIYRLCWWGDDGRRLWWRFVPGMKPISDWCRLDTPRRMIYHRSSQSADDQKVRTLFIDASGESDQIKMRIVDFILSKDAESVQAIAERALKWKRLINEARYLLIYRREPGMAGGWAQSEHPKTSSCVLALERLFCHLGPWTLSAVGHESAHVAQEVRNCALRREWVRRQGFRECMKRGCLHGLRGRNGPQN